MPTCNFRQLRMKKVNDVEVTHGRYTSFLESAESNGFAMMRLKLFMKHTENSAIHLPAL